MVPFENDVVPAIADEEQFEPCSRNIHVLIVDDEETIVEVMRAVLEAAGYTTMVADGGRRALKLAQDFPGSIDLLITDIRMPEMSGTELAQQMQTLRPATKVLYMSAFAGDLFASGQIRHGVNFLPKPFTPATLLEKLRGFLRRGPRYS